MPQEKTDGTRLLCGIPVLNLPRELHEELENASKLNFNSNGSGVAVYWTSDGHVRTDVYVGLILDGYKLYQNISAVNPNITMQFVPKPTVSCSPGDVHFDPDEDELISIKVSDCCSQCYTCLRPAVSFASVSSSSAVGPT